jgi:hypothetical protein
VNRAGAADRTHRGPWLEKSIATDWRYGQIQSVPTVGRYAYLRLGKLLVSADPGSHQAPVRPLDGHDKKVRKWALFAAFPPPPLRGEIADDPRFY